VEHAARRSGVGRVDHRAAPRGDFLRLFFALIQKFALALAQFSSLWALDLAGYIRGAPDQPLPVQPESVLLVLRVLVGPVTALIVLLSVVFVYLYPITKARHAEIRAQLRARGLPE
jgi:GPH family glycoside/pentoside/hexuronide:cation symporter